MNDSVSTLPIDDANGVSSDRFSSSDNFNEARQNDEEAGPGNTTSRRMLRNGSKRYGVVDRRQQRQNDHSRAEQRFLLGERDDSDLEHNIGRLCQYLSGSEDEGEDDEDLKERAVAAGVSSVNGQNLQRPADLFILNSRQNYQKRSVGSAGTSSSLVSDETCNCAQPEQMPSHQASDNSAQVIPMQRLVPRDFLNIPPPAQPPPPEDSPSAGRPLPPQRTLPPLPDEPVYEEAKPAPPPPMPRPSKAHPQHKQHKIGPQSISSLNSSGKASAVVSPVMASSCHSSHHEDDTLSKPLYLSQGSQYNDIDWHNYETSILERNEAGSFYIPSGQTTMSSVSPSRKSEMEQKHNNYSLSPAAQTTVPVPMLPTRQEPNASNNRFRPNPSHPKGKVQPGFPGRRDCGGCYSWRCMTYSLAATMLFALAVIVYLLYANVTASSSFSSSGSPAGSPYGSSSHYGYATYSTATVDETNPSLPSATLRPLPESFALGDDVIADLIPRYFGQTYFTLQRNSYVQFNVSLESQTKLAFYGRQTLPASPTEYDFVRIVQGTKFHTRRFDSGRRARAADGWKRFPDNLRSTTFVQYLSGGRWHLLILNDDTEVRTVRFSASLTDAEREECKNNCHNKGVCKEGKCYCFDGFTGAYCEETFCPVLCSGNGIFAGGKCHCHHGWKGADCDVPANVCEVPNCNGHGQCNNKGECLCDKGYKGPFCDQRACPHENCSGHGVCHNGKCYCDFGYKGDSCDEAYTSQGLCPSTSGSRGQCNGRGYFDSTSGVCVCEQGWLGERCEKRICQLNCGSHGKCINDACQCDEGYTGAKCEILACAPGCEENGKCTNGTCVCNDGWNGENCQLAGCPNSCNQGGECKKMEGTWRCVCSSNFGGEDCSVPVERQCSDNIDNDSDGLVDCEDSECCSSVSCQNDQYCRTVPDPYQVLIRKPSPPPQASFFQKTSFLLDSDSVQQYADATLFNESRVSVVRGRVVNSGGSSLMAVRIANAANALYGFTLSRAGGYFDLVVDGGGSVTLQFMRKPFLTYYSTVVVPWNQIVYIGDVVLTMKNGEDTTNEASDRWSPSCLAIFKKHDIKPYAVPSWKYGGRGAPSSATGIVADAAAVQESLRIPGTDIYLTYFSSNAVGRASTLSLYLVPPTYPKTLRLVRLTIDVEGVHFETTLEAKANLTYIYGWDKRNVYKQQVIGLAAARIKVGYIYANCQRVFWETMTTKLNGYTSSISEIGGWNLNVHHRYNILGNVLEKGDGASVYLREELAVLATTVGTKEQRSLSCQPPACNGPVATAQLYSPIALATSRDGSLFIGDYNLIRWMSGQNIQTILELSIADTAHRYYLAVHPISGEVYVSLPLRRQIWKIRSLNPSAADLSANYEIMVGSGEICSVETDCGDGASADTAALTYPKGIAFDAQGNLYIADDRRIRMVSTSGFMSTVIGASPTSSDYSSSGWQPLACLTVFSAQSFRPMWPTSVTFDYSSSSVLFMDTDVIFELKANSKLVTVRAGAPSHCMQLVNSKNETVRPALLKGAVAIASADNGRVLVTETDRKRMHRVRLFDRYGRSSHLAGAESKCDCHRRHCPCDDSSDTSVAGLEAHLHNPSSIAVSQDGKIHIADEGNFKVKTLKFATPTLDAKTKLYEILSPDSQEVYYFNRFGQHVATKDMLTDRFLYNFTYHLDTSYGKLSHIIGPGGHKIYVIRKSASRIFIENTNGLKSTAYINQFDQMLEKFVSPTGAETRFNYEANAGLLTSKVDSSKRVWFYEYDSKGRLKRTVLPTGDILVLSYGLYFDRLLVDVKNEKGLDWHLAVSDSEMKVRGERRERAVLVPSGSVYHIYAPSDVAIHYDSSGYLLPDATQSTLVSRRKLSVPATIDPPRPAKTVKVEWRYYVRRSGRSHKRVAQVNGVNVLTVEYDRDKNVDLILNQNNDKIITIYYNAAGFVTQWASATSTIGVMNITYDPLGRVVNQNWASMGRSYSYDREGRVIETGDSADTFKKTKKLSYTGEQNWPLAVETPSGLRYALRFDPSGSLSNITSPSGQVRRFNQSIDMGAVNVFYYHPNSSKPHILSKRMDGSPLATYFAHGHKRVAFLYDASSRLSKIIHDQTDVAMDYHPKTGLLSSVKSVSNDRTTLELNYGYQGHLLVEVLDRRWLSVDTATSKLPTVSHWFYQYDDRLRLRSVQSLFDDTMSGLYKIDYDTLTGRITSVNGYQMQCNNNKIRMYNERSSVETTLSPNMAVSQTKFTVKGKTMSEQRVFYDSAGRIISSTVKADGNDGGVVYEYNADGRLATAKLTYSGVDHNWNYAYTPDGGLAKVNDVQLTYDTKNGFLKRYGKLDYVTDQNGFIIQRGQENFQYDSFGRLIKAWQPGQYENRYFYDDKHRLVTVERSKGTSWHFYYALLNNPGLITHAYDINKRTQIVFTYDNNDRLMAVETNGIYYFVVTHANGTPMHVFSDDGTLVKTVLRSPLGVVTVDTAPDFLMFIGHKGAYQDIESGVVIFQNGRPFEPNVGRFLSASVEHFFDLDVYHPEATVDPFLLDPRNLISHVPTFDQGVTDWLLFNGYDANDIATWLTPANELTFACDASNSVHISSECWLQKRISSLHTLRSVHATPLLPQTPFDQRSPVSFSAISSLYGDGALVVNNSNVASLFSAEWTGKSSKDPMQTLLNHSYILPVFYVSDEGGMVNYFLKKDIEKATADLSALGAAGKNASLRVVSVRQGGARKEIVIAMGNSQLRVRYGGENVQSETRLIVEESLEKTASLRWEMEKEKALSSGSVKSQWNEKELGELKSKGRIDSYLPQYRMDPLLHPALLMDPNNVKFTKR